jgi:hypothetical protein
MLFPIKDVDGNILEHQTILTVGDPEKGLIEVRTKECTYLITVDFYLELIKYNNRSLFNDKA